jgi:hypothetical protein
MKTSDEWISEIEDSIITLSELGRKTYYAISAEMTKHIANRVSLHFSSNEKYSVEVNRCNSCTNKYDIIITWS